MSLEALLKSGEPNTAWNVERLKLGRFALGFTISTLALVIGALILFSLRQPVFARAPAIEPASATSSDSKSLAQLMRIQRESAGLSDDVQQLRAQTPPARGHVGGVRNVAYGARHPGVIINYDPGDGFARLGPPKPDLYIPTGAVFQAQLLTPIKTSVERTFVMAETTREFRMDAQRRLPKGTRLIGTSRLNPVLKGVIVEFNTVVSPQGIETSISGLALSRNALPEIEGLFFSDKLLTYGTAMAFGFLSGFADAARTRDVGLLGSTPQVSPANDVLTGFSTASFQVANEILRDIRATAIEYVVVPAGEQIFVALTRRYDLRQGEPK